MANSWIMKNKEDIQKVITIKKENNSLHIYVDFTLCSESIREFLNLHIEELVDDGIGTYENGTIIILDKNRQRLDDDLLSLFNISHAVQNTENQKKENKMVVVAEDGTKITLNSDGTWEEYKEEVVVLSDNNFDVRKVNWGMNQSEVKDTETLEPFLDVEDTVAYKATLNNHSCAVVYRFHNNELVSMDYNFDHTYSDDARFVNDFETLKDSLVKKYGKPSENNRYFTSEIYDDNISDWGMALSTGELSFFTTWLVNKTKILLALYGDNYEVSFSLSYISLEHEDIVNEDDKQIFLDDI